MADNAPPASPDMTREELMAEAADNAPPASPDMTREESMAEAAGNAPPASPDMTREELMAEAARGMKDINKRFDAPLPKDRDELLELLTEAETWMFRLKQDEKTMTDYTLSPTDTALISRDLLDHSDPEVKLVVTSCLTEVIRLKAPNAPYGDDIMKEIFQRIVATFADLGDINSHSYERRLSILQAFSRVKCPILMLDLEMDHQIRDIFHHLLKAASPNHPEKVIGSMEHILTAVIDETDYIHEDLASFLLQYLTKVAQETVPASFGLAERVVGSCKDRLKPMFVQLLRGNLDNYSSIVISLCQDASGPVTNHKADASITEMEGEVKNSEGPVSEESPRETTKTEQDDCPGQDGTHPTITPATAIEQQLIKDDAKSPSVKESSVKRQDTDEDTDEDTGLKEMVSTTKMDKTNGQQEINEVSKRKSLQEAEEAPPSKKNKMLDENLVGSRVRVWWPDDKMFYNGVIESFNASSKKHKVAYDDGDVEILLLRKERWELIDEEQGTNPDLAADMARARRGRGRSSQGTKKGKTGTSHQSGSMGPPKKRGRPKGVRSSNNLSNTDSLVATSASLKRKGAEDIEEAPKPDGKFNIENSRLTRSAAKAKEAAVKASNKDEAGSTKSANESTDKAGSEDGRQKDEVKSSEAADGPKHNGPLTRRKLKEIEGKSSERAFAKVYTGKKRGRKSHN